MARPLKQKLIRRLRIIGGQVEALEKMLEKGAYCVDIITQASAAKQALSSFEDEVLLNHLNTHVVEQIKGGKHAKATTEVMKLYKLAKRT